MEKNMFGRSPKKKKQAGKEGRRAERRGRAAQKQKTEIAAK